MIEPVQKVEVLQPAKEEDLVVVGTNRNVDLSKRLKKGKIMPGIIKELVSDKGRDKDKDKGRDKGKGRGEDKDKGRGEGKGKDLDVEEKGK